MTVIRLSECSEAQLDYVLGNILGIGPLTRWRMPTPIAHGERRGATQHRRRGIPMCGPCLAAENSYKRAHDREQGGRRHVRA